MLADFDVSRFQYERRSSQAIVMESDDKATCVGES
jgi:hypothetical protein